MSPAPRLRVEYLLAAGSLRVAGPLLGRPPRAALRRRGLRQRLLRALRRMLERSR